MICPKCGSDNDKVLESRTNKDGDVIRRRRECLVCHNRFTSYERIEERPVIVIKKDGRRQNFDIGKVEHGLIACTEKLGIFDSLEDLKKTISDDVEEIASKNPNNTIKSQEIGEVVLRALYPLSPVAYVRFAAVYREFDSLDQFIDEIKSLTK